MSGVRRVWGTADDIQLVFTYNSSTGRWEAEVPVPADGRYAVALFAEDFAGNTAYIAKLLFTIDLRNMCVTFSVVEVNSNIGIKLVDSNAGMPEVDSCAAASEVTDDAFMREISSFLISLDGCKKGIGGCSV